MILPSNFTIEKYGLKARFVEESDAAFIVALRTNPKHAKFLHFTDSSEEVQKQWIRDYKLRENNGTDYYFIFFYNNEPVGVSRIYAIHDGQFTFGSWVFKDGLPFFCSIAGAIIAREIAFETMGLKKEIEKDGSHIDNKKVIRFSKQLGMVFNGQREDDTGIYMTGYLEKEAFEENKKDICRLFNLESFDE